MTEDVTNDTYLRQKAISLENQIAETSHILQDKDVKIDTLEEKLVVIQAERRGLIRDLEKENQSRARDLIAETNCILKDKEVQIQALVEESNIILNDKDLTIQTLQEKLVVIQAERRGLIRAFENELNGLHQIKSSQEKLIWRLEQDKAELLDICNTLLHKVSKYEGNSPQRVYDKYGHFRKKHRSHILDPDRHYQDSIASAERYPGALMHHDYDRGDPTLSCKVLHQKCIIS